MHDSILPASAHNDLAVARSYSGSDTTVALPAPRDEGSVVKVVVETPAAKDAIQKLLEGAGYRATSGDVPAQNTLFAASDEIVPLAELERRAIDHALKVTGGRVARAAKLLGIGRATLYRRLAGRSVTSELTASAKPDPTPSPFH